MNIRSLLYCLLWPLIMCCENKKHTFVRTFAGSGKMGMADGQRDHASFANLMGIAADKEGNLYVADSHNNVIRKINSYGTVTTFAGSGVAGSADGEGSAASFFYPTGVAVDRNGNVYVSDTHNNLIRKIDSLGVVTTFAGKRTDNGVSVNFDNPTGLAVDAVGNVYVADWGNDVVRKINVSGKATVLAGSLGEPGCKDGVGTSASFYLPWGLVVDADDNVYVADCYNNMIRKIDSAGVVTTLAGKKEKGSLDGKGSAASFFHPASVAIDKHGNLFVADMGNNKIRMVSPQGLVTTCAGNGIAGLADGYSMAASFRKPYGVAIGTDGSVFVADYLNNVVRKINSSPHY